MSKYLASTLAGFAILATYLGAGGISSAHAGGLSVGVVIGVPFPAPVVYAPAPVYYPEPVYYPPPVYYAPRVVYSPPVYYAPRVIYSQPYYRHHGHDNYRGHRSHNNYNVRGNRRNEWR